MTTMRAELQALREEVTKLRERVAVLEAAPRYTPMMAPTPSLAPPWVVTCDARATRGDNLS